MSTEPSAIATDLRAMAAAAERQADDFDKTDAQKMLAAAEALDRLAALEAVAEAARRWRENARPAVAVVKAATFDDVQAMSEKAARFGDALAAALDALEDQQPAAVQEPTEGTTP